MNKNTIQILFALVRSAVSGNPLADGERGLYSTEILPSLITVSKKHDIAHLVAKGIEINSLPTDDSSQIKKEIFVAVYRYTQLSREYEKLCTALESAKIRFIPLKGSVLRNYYPEAWMRTSCDTDILVEESEVEKTAEYLINTLGYTYENKNSHDISLYTPGKLHIELHYDLLGDFLTTNSRELLKSVWDTSVSHASHEYWLEMPDEVFYFYHIAHMAKHFENGGCGIRPFIDLWILDSRESADGQKRDDLLGRGNLLKFANAARHLSKVWFGDAEHDDVTRQMEEYILRGGVYGTAENLISVQQQKKGGRFKYALSKIFLPYSQLKFHYPILQKHPILTPIMEVRRWGKLIFCGHLNRSVQELKYNNSISADEAERIKKLLNDIGL